MTFIMAAFFAITWLTTGQDWSLLAAHIYLAAWMVSIRRAGR